jgi:hypothetical protein
MRRAGVVSLLLCFVVLAKLRGFTTAVDRTKIKIKKPRKRRR